MSDQSNNVKESDLTDLECGRCGRKLENLSRLCPCYDNPLNKTKSAQPENKDIEELRKVK